MSDKRTKCTVADGKVLMCQGLKDAIAGEYLSKRKGLTLLAIMNVRTGRTTRTGVVLRSGSFEDKGVVINYCPFCGEAIAEQFKGREEASEQ